MPQDNQKKVGLLIFGANGYMAHDNALTCLPRVQRDLIAEGILLHIPILADFKYYSEDPSEAAAARARAEVKLADLALSSPPDYLASADQAIGRLARERQYDTYDAMVIYDATSAQFHEDHLIKVLSSHFPKLFYFGEKPLVTDPAQLEAIKRPPITGAPFFCDFIETKNPAVTMMKGFVTENRLTIKNMAFWRASSSGIKHLLGHPQQGVQGGALLDKAAHDLSIAAMLLGPDRVARTHVESADIQHLIPKPADGGGFVFLDKRNDYRPESELSFDIRGKERANRLQMPADGMCEFAVRWTTTAGDEVSSRFLFSWLGYLGAHAESKAHPSEAWFVSELLKRDISPETWLMKQRAPGKDSVRACLETQARIAIVDTVDPSGRKVTIISNYLIHENDAGAKVFDRWVKVFFEGASSPINIPIENAETYHLQKQIDLANIFKAVIMDCAGGSKAVNIGSDASLLVHQVMLDAYDKCADSAQTKLNDRLFDHVVSWKHIESTLID